MATKDNYELRVGFFTLFALILLLYGWGWLKSFSPFDPPTVFWVRFHDLTGLSNNATVNIQGVRVGTVDQVSFKPPDGLQDPPDTDPQTAKLPRVYVRIKVTAYKQPVPRNSAVTIQTLGMVGAKYVEITLPERTDADKVDPIDPNVIVMGEDPVRLEMVITNIASKLKVVAGAISSKEAATTVKDLSSVAAKLNKTMDEMPALTASLRKATDRVSITADRFGEAAGDTKVVATSADKFFREGSQTMGSIRNLSGGLSTTNNKVGRILDNPELSKDLKETMSVARKTMDSVADTVTQVSTTIKDKDLRSDLLSMLTKIQESTDNINKSMDVVSKLGKDDQLRLDVKTAAHDAREAVTKASTLLADPAFKNDAVSTMGKVRSAANDVDTAARQLQGILGKRFPLFHMMLGRPGQLVDKKDRCPNGTTVNAKPERATVDAKPETPGIQ